MPSSSPIEGHAPDLDQRGPLFLNASDLDGLGLTAGDLEPALVQAFHARASGTTRMPPMTFFHRRPKQWFHLNMSWAPSLGFAAAKFQSGDFTDRRQGPSSIQGLLVLCDETDGRMVAVMDSRWITGLRTAAASAMVARRFAPPDARRLAILGCGLQARLHLKALKNAVPTLEQCVVHDIRPKAAERFVRENDGITGLAVSRAGSHRSLVRDADIVVTAGIIMGAGRQPDIGAGDLGDDVLVITLDHDSYLTDEAIAGMDIVITDDREQFDHERASGAFAGVTRVDADLSEILAHGASQRGAGRKRICALMLGLAIEDLATAVLVYRLALDKGVGHAVPG